MWITKIGMSVKAFLLFLSLGLLSACQVNNINLKPLMDASSKSSDMFEKTLEEEVELGQEVSGVLLKNSAFYNVKDVQQYVSSIGHWLAQHTERPEVPWQFAVLRDDSFNAFATPGGFIYITTGTLSQLDNEAELAGILAHEIAHVVKKHHLAAIQKEAQVGVAVDLLKFAHDSSRDNDSSVSSSPVFADVSAESKLLNGIQDIYSNGLAREDELEADSMGMVIAARAGYDPQAYVKVLQKIDAQQADHPFWKTFSKRHPSAKDRLTAIEKTAEDLSKIDGKTLEYRFSQELK
ncbi:M48 family metalloprotease [Neptuniibacter sp.]|uniref:M48 family metalloprotease n=1 Tax=Neptuniibacter sp. TaxID=1962643 RepID=UPI002635F48C|nr:M48 family metalloprotease [Neptuniibacter sp.]MCP4597850.1 M48 family metalloprotease [Neptuniibacter sp.]